MRRCFAKYFIILLFVPSTLPGQEQISIPRIEAMPNHPSPYLMRNWKQVALGYDSLVFDLNAVGQYLPLIRRNTATVNYPQHESFGLATVVGTTSPTSAEAINVLPAVIGASLAGIDKSSQNGRNWVLMCEEFFNNRPEENIYLNHPVTSSGNDWWYETMPNVYFYQLYDLYPGVGDFERQFTLVAEQWLKAVAAMGGSTTPWKAPRMNYRAWSFSQMQPLTSGVPEPEAAGAIAWLLYNAYSRTGEEKQRIGAEWAMEFLNNYQSNPAYELQLPYGVYTAARMNAELGTSYDIKKMVNWCFERSPLRSWGAILGTWGGYDVHGLIGEIASNDYAFLMNGFEQAGALVPMVRYDERFARAVGKWMLNMANASRLFYPNYLPPQKQDSDEWSVVYDPRSFIGHEAMRREQYGISPYATGDAMSGGWGKTNLALYASSHVGILGGIIDSTTVPKILTLDLLKTDYFHRPAFPTFLLYNPYEEDQSVELDTPQDMGSCDMYEAISNQFLSRGVGGSVNVTIPADQAVLLVFVPAGGSVSYHYDQMLVDGVVIDFHSGHFFGNYPPRIKSLAARPDVADRSQTVSLFCAADDHEGDPLRYTWTGPQGAAPGDSPVIEWTPTEPGSATFTCIVEDGNGGRDSSRVTVTVIDNRPPVISQMRAEPEIIDPDGMTTLECRASDADADSLFYFWQAEAGSLNGDGPRVTWTAPDVVGYYRIRCQVVDQHGAETQDSVAVTVGRLVGDYPLNGDANDASGFDNHGTISGALPAADRFGTPNGALAFDGVDDVVAIAGRPSLNSEKAVAINLWLKWQGQASKEEYVLSQGSWQNRLKISLLQNRQLRWTIKTSAGVADLDSQTEMASDVWTNVCVLYGEKKLQLYINGVENAAKSWSGDLAVTSLDVLFAQMLPGDQQYNFTGILDDVKIYNRLLTAEEIAALYDHSMQVNRTNEDTADARLLPPFPNPFNSSVTIPLPAPGQATIRIYDIAGRLLRTLDSAQASAHQSKISWDARDKSGSPLPSGLYFVVIEQGRSLARSKILYIK